MSDQNNKSWWDKWFWPIAGIALIILTIGALIWISDDQTTIEGAEEPEEPKKLEDPLKLAKERLVIVKEKISELAPLENGLKKTERIIFRSSRITVGVVILCLNGLWFHLHLSRQFDLGEILNFNESLLLLYAFVAFLIYGTPGRFVKAMKNKISGYLARNHLGILGELKVFRKEEKELIKRIKDLEDDASQPSD
jgi:hypothetical protein